MLFRGIKHQVDKGPVDSVTGKAKYTLNDNRLLREDVEYRPLVRVCSGQVSMPRYRAYLAPGYLLARPFIYCGGNAWPPTCLQACFQH